MRNVILVLLVLIAFGSCTESDQDIYTGQKLDFQLFKASEFDYSGTFSVREMIDGNLEATIQLVGERSSTSTNFPAHLHYGNYTDPEAPMALMLTPVNGADLESKTVLGTLMDGTKLSFEDMKTFDGHVKVHLASEGPDYKVILVAGNVGSNVDEASSFDAESMTICSPEF
ncbi:hypothetical protein [Algoriphagus winogradskyi]|uniref:CHRD domain-containing protein n=1 Tax=Algoriphagus winogradskyi TaxID=237017 RepID=A0ABY1N9K4_9BACT|nr:hypothetical protein [Algoriphagus winogradskyi]SMP03751.1 hypothetical protein SAMN06265367_101207 [Algoriphagus winogradskyi]